MTRTDKAVYENGSLRLLERIEGLTDQQLLTVTIQSGESESPRSDDDPVLQVIGICESGLSDVATQHDHYLYGTPKR